MSRYNFKTHMDDRQVVTGNVVKAAHQYEAYKNIEVLKSGKETKTFLTTANFSQEINFDVLAGASESYHISSNPEDYIIVPLPIVTCDIPNRNKESFSLEECSYFDPRYGCFVYNTFNNKPCHKDHCFPAGTKIKMKGGTYKNIENVTVGDEVYTHLNRLKKVTKLFNNGIKPTFSINTIGTLSDILTTDNHPFYVVGRGQVFDNFDEKNQNIDQKRKPNEWREKKYRPHFRPLTDVCVGDYLCIPINFGGNTEVDKNFAFLVGAFLAEGNYNKKLLNKKKIKLDEPYRYGITLTIGSHEKEYREAILDAAKNLGLNPILLENCSQGADRINICNVEITNRLFALVGEYAHSKLLGEEIRNWSKESIKVVLGAYMSGDGGYDIKKGTFRMRTSSSTLARHLQEALAYVGIPACVNTDGKLENATRRSKRNTERGDKLVIYPNHDSHSVRISNFYSKELTPYLAGKICSHHAPLHDSGRMAIQDGFIITPVKNIKKFEELEVYNLEVEEDHSYIANDLVVHNCNSDPTKALGMHLDSTLIYNPKFDIWKISVLTIWDRTKDTQRVNDIINKKITGYSMGAFVDDFTCNICGAHDVNIKPCEHKWGTTYGASNRLAYKTLYGSCFFESSSVMEPADDTAFSKDVFI